MGNSSDRTTGNDPLDGVDPGGTHPTKPGNPDKSGPAKPKNVDQAVVSGDQNQPEGERAR